jgi:predicted O-methyltransferase YrrM
VDGECAQQSPPHSWPVRAREVTRELGASATLRGLALGGMTAGAARLAGWRSTAALLLGGAAGAVAKDVSERGHAAEREARNSTDAAALAAWLGSNLPALGAWSIEADFARLIVAEVGGRRRVVVECGSGMTTLLLAHALRQNGGGRVYSLEHDEGFARETTALLERAGLTDQAEVIVAPLARQRFGSESVEWYDLSVAGDRLPHQIDLLIVDGPPATTPWARWPALIALADRLTLEGTVLMDDGRRRHERRVAYRWASEHPELDLFWLDTVKGTWRLRRHGIRADPGSRPQAAYRALRRRANPYPVGHGRWPVQR